MIKDKYESLYMCMSLYMCVFKECKILKMITKNFDRKYFYAIYYWSYNCCCDK